MLAIAKLAVFSHDFENSGHSGGNRLGVVGILERVDRAADQTGYCAIRRDGTTACWGDNMIVPQGW